MSVSSIAATACLLEIASQKTPKPSSNDRETTAAIGSSTMIDRYPTTMPRVRPGPPRRGTGRPASGGPAL